MGKIQEPEDNWTWYDYKLECVRALSSIGLSLRVGGDCVHVYKDGRGQKVYTTPKKMGWKNFYHNHLKGLVEKYDR